MGADKLIGTSWRSEALNQSGVHICDIDGFLADAQGQLWIPVRSSAKACWLGASDTGMGGTIGTGES